jgi:hypothetical protein
MVDDLDLSEMRRVPRISYYFRYPLHRHDFHELKTGSQLRGHYTAKPLYRSLMPNGPVDCPAGYNGDIAAKRTPLANGRRNWAVIRRATERGIREMLAR